MILTDLVDGDSIFLDANILVYHFAPHPTHGQVCNDLIRRVENQALIAYTSTAVLSDVAHHLMTFEASALFGWASKVVQRLRQDPSAVMKLSKFHICVGEVPKLGIRVLNWRFWTSRNAAASGTARPVSGGGVAVQGAGGVSEEEPREGEAGA
jgi:predicted nucleic acid-binding protein